METLQTENVEVVQSEEVAFDPKKVEEVLQFERANAVIEGERKKRAEQMKAVTPHDEVLLANAKARNLTEEAIDELSAEELAAVYTNGEDVIDLDVPFENNPERELQFKRDFLKLVVQYDAADREYEEKIETIKKEIGYDREEFQQVIAQFGEYQEHIRQQLVSNIDTAPDELSKKRAEKLLVAFDNALNQENILASLAKADKENILKDFYSEPLQLAVYNRYKTVLKRLGLNVDLVRFPGVEKGLGEPYTQYENLFVFAIMRTVAYEKYSTEAHKFYLASLMTVLQEYLAGSMAEERRVTFEAGIKSVIDHIIA